MTIKSIYVIGSLKNDEITKVSKLLREQGFEVFDDWKAPGPDADDYLRDYYRERGLTYSEILGSHGVQHVFNFDKFHLDRCDCALLVMPAGKSGHLELGYTVGKGKPGFILMDQEPERVDVMHSFATKVFMNKEEMIEYFKSDREYISSGSRAPTVGEVPRVSKGFEEIVRREFESYCDAFRNLPTANHQIFRDDSRGRYYFYE